MFLTEISWLPAGACAPLPKSVSPHAGGLILRRGAYPASDDWGQRLDALEAAQAWRARTGTPP